MVGEGVEFSVRLIIRVLLLVFEGRRVDVLLVVGHLKKRGFEVLPVC